MNHYKNSIKYTPIRKKILAINKAPTQTESEALEQDDTQFISAIYLLHASIKSYDTLSDKIQKESAHLRRLKEIRTDRHQHKLRLSFKFRKKKKERTFKYKIKQLEKKLTSYYEELKTWDHINNQAVDTLKKHKNEKTYNPDKILKTLFKKPLKKEEKGLLLNYLLGQLGLTRFDMPELPKSTDFISPDKNNQFPSINIGILIDKIGKIKLSEPEKQTIRLNLKEILTDIQVDLLQKKRLQIKQPPKNTIKRFFHKLKYNIRGHSPIEIKPPLDPDNLFRQEPLNKPEKRKRIKLFTKKSLFFDCVHIGVILGITIAIFQPATWGILTIAGIVLFQRKIKETQKYRKKTRKLLTQFPKGSANILTAALNKETAIKTKYIDSVIDTYLHQINTCVTIGKTNIQAKFEIEMTKCKNKLKAATTKEELIDILHELYKKIGTWNRAYNQKILSDIKVSIVKLISNIRNIPTITPLSS